MNIQDEHYFINFQQGSKTLKNVREILVNTRFSSRILSAYKKYHIVGFTLNKNKSTIIRLFLNKYDDPEGDTVSESVHFSSLKAGVPSERIFKTRSKIS